MLIGYACVGADDQYLRIQRAALKAAGCQRTFEEKHPDAAPERPALLRLLDEIRDEDVVVVTHLNRFARTTSDLLDLADRLNTAGVGLRSLAEPWADTTRPAGHRALAVLAGVAEFERSSVRPCTCGWREAAKSRGVRFGRPAKLSAEKIAFGRQLIRDGHSMQHVATMLDCHRSTLHRALNA